MDSTASNNLQELGAPVFSLGQRKFEHDMAVGTLRISNPWRSRATIRLFSHIKRESPYALADFVSIPFLRWFSFRMPRHDRRLGIQQPLPCADTEAFFQQ
jgi:hypothetical protein